MGFIVKQMMDEPIILLTYRRPDATIHEATAQAKTIAHLLQEIGDFAYIVLDISGHRHSFQTLYCTIHDVLKGNRGKISNPSQSIVFVGSPALMDFHQTQMDTDKSERFTWVVTNDLDHAITLLRAKIEEHGRPSHSTAGLPDG